MNRAFEESFFAARYVLGARGEQLLDGLPADFDREAAWLQALLSEERGVRAGALRGPLRRLASALDERKLA